jgi:hypothetical protein
VGPELSGNRYSPQRVGAGRVDVDNAATSSVIAYNSVRPDRVSLSYGLVEVVDTATAQQTITVENKGMAEATYTVSVDTTSDLDGVTFTPDPTSVTVPAGDTATITLTMNATAADMNLKPDTTIELEQQLARHYLSEESGYVVLTPAEGAPAGAAQDLRIPYYSIARPSSNMAATPASVTLQPDEMGMGSFDLTLSGDQLLTNGDPADPLAGAPVEVVSLVTPMELAATDACGDAQPLSFFGDINDDDARPEFDLRYGGVTTNYSVRSDIDGTATPTEGGDDTYLYFGFVTCGPIPTFAIDSIVNVYVDSPADGNLDGTSDFVFYNDNLAQTINPASDPTDVYVINRCIIDPTAVDVMPENPCSIVDVPNSVLTSTADTSLLLSDTVVVPLPAAALGLTAEDAEFGYYYSSEEFGFTIDFMDAPDNFDPTQAVFDFTGNETTAPLDEFFGQPTYLDLDGNTIPVSYTVSADNDVNDLLLIHHHNTLGDRAEVISTELNPMVVDTIPAPADLAVTGVDTLPVLPTFSWTHTTEGDFVAPADWYNLEVVDADGNVAASDWYPVDAICTGTSCTVDTTNFGLASAAFSGEPFLPSWGMTNGDYTLTVSFWTEDGGLSDNTATATFNVNFGGVEAITRVSPPLSEGSLTDSTVSFSWEADPNALYYQLWAGTSDFSESVVVQWYAKSDLTCMVDETTMVETCSVAAGLFTNTGEYDWYVQGWGPAGVGPWQETAQTFMIDAGTLDTVTIIGPTGTVDTPSGLVAQWTGPLEADYFNVSIPAVTFDEWLPADNVCSVVGEGETAEYSCSVPLDAILVTNGTYEWSVTPWSPGGVGTAATATAVLSFGAVGEVEDLLPGQNFEYESGQNFYFDWVAQPNATWYQVFIGTADLSEVIEFEWYRGTDVCQTYGQPGGATCSVRLDLEPGTYTWYVQPYGPAGIGPWNNLGEGEQVTFTVN